MNKTKISSRAAKVEFLRANTQLWQGTALDGGHDKEAQRKVVAAMKAASLISPSTYASDVHLDSLIAEAREAIR
jgi:hypothetical protein